MSTSCLPCCGKLSTNCCKPLSNTIVVFPGLTGTDSLMVRRRYAAEAVDSAVVHGVSAHGDDFMISVERDPDSDR